MATTEVRVPDIGGDADVPVIEILVKPGDTVTLDQGLVTLESDKATMAVSYTHLSGIKLTMLAFLMKASVSLLKQYPDFNASLDESGENLTLKQYFHIGFAADTPNGLSLIHI